MFKWLKKLFKGEYVEWTDYSRMIEDLDREHWKEEIRKQNMKNKIFSS